MRRWAGGAGIAIAVALVALSWSLRPPRESPEATQQFEEFLTTRGNLLAPFFERRWSPAFIEAFLNEYRNELDVPADGDLLALNEFARSAATPEARTLALLVLRRWAPMKLQIVANVEGGGNLPAHLQRIVRGKARDSSPPRGLYISEVLASASGADGGASPDWLELHNTAAEPVSLAGWTLSDDPNEPTRWALPDSLLGPGQHLVIYADPHAPGEPRANFRLGVGGEFLGLYTPAGALAPATAFYPAYPPQRVNVSYGVVAGESRGRYFTTPTPGEANVAERAYDAVCAVVQFSRASGIQNAPFSLKLMCDQRGALIRYTLDGAAPQPDGIVYTAPIDVGKNTVMRAMAVAPGALPSEETSATYLFMSGILTQSTSEGWPEAWGEGGPADYAMDSEVVDAEAARIADSFRELPILSLTLPRASLFDGTTGIYTHTEEDGMAWERAARLEFVAPDGTRYATGCGLRIQGRSSRYAYTTPKHSFRVAFRGVYGDGELNAPRLFAEDGPDSFNTLVLRATSNHSWLYPRAEQREKAQYVRDVWMKDTQRAMGWAAPRCRYTHLFLNGIYWGLYVISERPDDAYMASVFGGDADGYDVIKGGDVVAGDDRMWRNVLALARGALNEEHFARIADLIDLDNFIDYLIVNQYAGNENWDFGNWYAARPKDGGHGFRFFAWDGENIFKRVGDNALSINHRDRGTELFHQLRRSPQFRERFAARVALHLTGDGALTPEVATQRFLRRAKEIDNAIAAESARWGDYRRDVAPYRTGPYALYTREGHWLKEQAWLRDVYFPERTAVVLGQYRSAGLAP